MQKLIAAGSTVALLLTGCAAQEISEKLSNLGDVIDPEEAPKNPAADAVGSPEAIPVVHACHDINKVLQPVVTSMVEQRIPYTQSPADEWRDCSGNFLRISSYLAGQCPALDFAAPSGINDYRLGGNNKAPGPSEARTTRGIAAWYDERGMFTPVFYDETEIDEAPQSLSSLRNRIKPGTVLWFSLWKPVAADGKARLFEESGGMITHMGTVVSVTKDPRGNVSGWEMYHGQNQRKGSGITSHWWDWPVKFTSGGKRYPPGGYWNQRIVGMAESIGVALDDEAAANIVTAEWR